MKLFEEFESDLEHVYDIKDLGKVMLANGIKQIAVNENGVGIELTPAGLVMNVPKEKWEILASGDYMTSVGAEHGMYSFVCQLSNTHKEDFTKATGFDFKVVE